MAQYQRFVAYVYEYSENKKGANKGFVKVEARDGKCKMDFQMKGLGSRQNIPGNIYGFIRNRDDNVQILFGTCNMAGDTVRYHAETSEENIMGSGYPLKQLAGIVVLTEGGTFYGTQWDDNPIRMGQFHFLTEAQEEPAPPVEEVSPEEPAPFEEEVSPEESAPPEEEVSPEESALPVEEVSPEETAPPEEAALPEETAQTDESVLQSPMEAGEAHPRETQQMDEFMQQEPVQELPQQQDTELRAEAVEESVFAPFRDGFITNCKKITPSESGIMNNFTLHGYRNYKHILKGQLQDTGQYIIGVPGFYEPQEKFMAGMFGFSNFKTAGYEEVTGQSVSNSRNGQQAPNYQFGYWYRVVSRR